MSFLCELAVYFFAFLHIFLYFVLKSEDILKNFITFLFYLIVVTVGFFFCLTNFRTVHSSDPQKLCKLDVVSLYVHANQTVKCRLKCLCCLFYDVSILQQIEPI
jgi:hypothetical protein